MPTLAAAACGRALRTGLRRWLAASFLLFGASQAMAQPQCAPGQWLAEYFPNIHLSGAPALQRCEAGSIDHYWTGPNGSPDPARLPVDGFSARWTATLSFPAGATRFITFTDDGVRVLVDGQRVIDNWTRHGITMDSATVPLAAGPHTVRMEYFEAGGEGLAQLVMENTHPAPPVPPNILSFVAQPGAIDLGGSSTLAWNVDNATGCTASGGWSGERPASGSASVSPGASTTYHLSCRNAAGATASASTAVTVRNAPPQQLPSIDSFAATPTRIAPGDSARLSWRASHAASCTASGGWSGTRAVEGSALVQPQASTSYTLSCANSAGQSVTATAQVAVDAANPRPPVGGLTARATPQGVRLDWNPVTKSGKWVNGYYTGWFWEDFPPEAVDMSTMTHFIFGRYAPGLGSLPGGRAGELMEGAGTAHTQAEDALIAKAHAAGTKAIMMVGGEFDGPGFMAATANPQIRAVFIKNILDKAEHKGYDGADIDWEENLDTEQGRAQALALLRELRTAAQQRPRYQANPFEISWPGFWVNTNFQEILPWHVEVAHAVDRFNLMTYSMAGDWGGGWLSWHHSPLFGEAPSHPTSIASTVQAYLNAGVPRAKLGIGVGLYGLFYNNPVTGPRQAATSGSNGGDGVNNYRRLREDNAFGQPGAAYHWDDVAKQSYISYSQPWWRASDAPVTYLSYEDERSIAEKGKWVHEQGLGGTLVWTINYGYLPQQGGTNPPMQAIKQSFIAASVSGYRVYRNGTAIATVTSGATYTDASAPSGNHSYQVAMLDAAGNEGPRSAAVTVQVP